MRSKNISNNGPCKKTRKYQQCLFVEKNTLDDGEHVKLGMFCLPVIVSSSG